jgi:hypothetical protein
MHRLTARFLIVLALVGNLAPIALSAAAPPRSCCFRKGVHHCQDSLTIETEQPVIRDASCCKGDCSRAITTNQSAYTQPLPIASFSRKVEAYLGRLNLISHNAEVSRFQSTRAPPAC